VLSREALKRFNEAHQESKTRCRKDGGDEDREIAKCLRSKGVYPGISVDNQKRTLFNPIKYTDHFTRSLPKWYIESAEVTPVTVSKF
jgi:hypothetical protein